MYVIWLQKSHPDTHRYPQTVYPNQLDHNAYRTALSNYREVKQFSLSHVAKVSEPPVNLGDLKPVNFSSLAELDWLNFTDRIISVYNSIIHCSLKLCSHQQKTQRKAEFTFK